MRNGYKVIDVDTHVVPNSDILSNYASPSFRPKMEELEPYKIQRDTGPTYEVNVKLYRRILGTAGEANIGVKASGNKRIGRIETHRTKEFEPDTQNMNSQGRIQDMDEEGRDVDFMFPGGWPANVSALDPSLWSGLYEAYHRYLDEYCSANPDRLKATMVICGADVEWAVTEIKRWANSKWVAGVWPIMPEGKPPDHPDNEPIWAAMNEAHLPIIHHSFTYYPPYFPGYRDVYDNIAIARTSAHPWGAQRLIASIVGAGILDRYPNLNMLIAECGHGWIAPFILRFDWQSQYAGGIQELKQKPSDYVRQGRVVPGIEFEEGEAMTKATFDVLGDNVLAFQSDYPHGETHFPESVDLALAWRSLNETQMHKLMHGNAERVLRL